MHHARGFSLIDLLISVIVAGLLVLIAVPGYQQYIERTKVERAIGDIRSIHVLIERFRLNNADRVPMLLDELGIAIPLDPWGMPYQYLNIEGEGPGVGGLRKDSFMNPLNSDYDLYSSGEDKESRDPLSNALSRDDIVRANNGRYVGPVSDY